MATLASVKKNYFSSIRQYLILTLVILIAATYYGFNQFRKLAAANDAFDKEQQTLATFQQSEGTISQQYISIKKAFDQRFAAVLTSLGTVYPSNENYTDLARLFDKFFQDNNTSANPVFVSDLKFGMARVDATKDFAVLPVTLTFSGTQDNFTKFLQFIQTSGVLEDKTRLMDVSSISINFIAPQNGGISAQPLLNVSVALNAYFEKNAPTTAKAKATS